MKPSGRQMLKIQRLTGISSASTSMIDHAVDVFDRAVQHQRGVKQRQRHYQNADDAPDSRREQPHRGVHADMRAHAHAIGNADHHQPGEQIEVRLELPDEACVESVAQDDLNKCQDRHHAEDQRDQALPRRGAPPPAATPSLPSPSLFYYRRPQARWLRPPSLVSWYSDRSRPLRRRSMSLPIWPSNFFQTGCIASTQALCCAGVN